MKLSVSDIMKAACCRCLCARCTYWCGVFSHWWMGDYDPTAGAGCLLTYYLPPPGARWAI